MTTLVLPPRHTGDAQRMWRAANARGWKVMRAMGWRVGALRGDVCIYGEPLFCRAVAQQLGLTLVEPALDWLATLPRDLLHRDVRFGTLSDALDGVFPAFVKPADQKAFEARVYASRVDLEESSADRSTPTLVSDPVRFESEFRVFTLDSAVVTSSLYSRYGDSVEDGSAEELAEAEEFANRVLEAHRPCGAAVVDVGRLTTGEWVVVEANPCWGSALYACDVEVVLDVIRAASA